MPFSSLATLARRRHVSSSALLLSLALTTLPALAIDIPVDVLGDPVPNGCTPGDCSLREAVTLANSLAGPDRILLPATPGLPLQLSIPGADENGNATGDLDILGDLEIVGAGVDATVLVQTASDRLFHSVQSASQRLTLRGLTIQGGNGRQGGALNSSAIVLIEDAAFVGNRSSDIGGAIDFRTNSAASLDDTRLELRRVRFEDNVALDGGGGAVHASNSKDDVDFLLIEDSQFEGNESARRGGAVYLDGSANEFSGTVTVRRSQFLDNRTGGEGGSALSVIFAKFVIRIEDSLFDGNVSTSTDTFAKGAIAILRSESLDIVGSTFSSNTGSHGAALFTAASTKLIDSQVFDNTATYGGGGIWAQGDLLVDRSTFESNRVTSTDAAAPGGGAIDYAGFTRFLGIQRSTFSGNDAFRGGAITVQSGNLQLYGSTLVAPTTGIAGRTGTVLRFLEDDNARGLALANSILSGSCTFPSAERRLAVAYNNIEGPGTTCRLAGAVSAANNRTGTTSTQFALGRLDDHGGPTLTYLPAAGSIVINAGRAAYCTTTDQRYFPVTDSRCDVGAVEVGASAAPDAIFGDGFDGEEI